MFQTRALPVFILSMLTGACATVPAPIGGDFAPSTPADAQADGTRVRWGGLIVATEPSASGTCLEVLSKPLGSGGRPQEGDLAHGRFLACQGGFADPAIFAPGREVTIVGSVAGRAERRLGGFSYEVTRIDATAIHLWPRRVPVDPRCTDPWGRSPWHGPGWWGPRHPFWW